MTRQLSRSSTTDTKQSNIIVVLGAALFIMVKCHGCEDTRCSEAAGSHLPNPIEYSLDVQLFPPTPFIYPNNATSQVVGKKQYFVMQCFNCCFVLSKDYEQLLRFEGDIGKLHIARTRRK